MDDNLFRLLRQAAVSEEDSDLLGSQMSKDPQEDYAMDSVSFTSTVESDLLDDLTQVDESGDLTLGYAAEADDDLVAIWGENIERDTASKMSYAFDREAAAYERSSEAEERQFKIAFQQSVDTAVIEARKALHRGVRGAALNQFLEDRYPEAVLKSAYPIIASRAIDEFLVGNVIVEPAMYASCEELARELRHGHSPTAKFAAALEDCSGCPKRTGSHCNLFKKTLVSEVPNDQRVFAHYRDMLSNQGLIGGEIVKAASSVQDYRLAIAAIFAEAHKNTQKRKATRKTYSTDVTYSPDAAPQRRSSTPRTAVLSRMESMLEKGYTVDQIRSASSLLGKTAFSDSFLKVANRFEAIPWETFGNCNHPFLLDKRGSFLLEKGSKCEGCVHNRVSGCALNKKSFADVELEVAEFSEATLSGYQEHFSTFDETPDLTVEANDEGLPGLDATQITGLGKFEV